jgi:beta-galactosidase/beta-glucuronidase
MCTLHVIRLRGPWEFVPLAEFVEPVTAESCRVVESTADLPPAGRLQMPGDWGASLGVAFRGRVEFRRRFGRPTGIDGGERVWLVCDGADAWAKLTLNGEPLGHVAGPAEAAEFDVTGLLRERNELAAVVECPRRAADGACLDRGPRADLPGGLIGEVRLEIRGLTAT